MRRVCESSIETLFGGADFDFALVYAGGRSVGNVEQSEVIPAVFGVAFLTFACRLHRGNAKSVPVLHEPVFLDVVVEPLVGDPRKPRLWKADDRGQVFLSTIRFVREFCSAIDGLELQFPVDLCHQDRRIDRVDSVAIAREDNLPVEGLVDVSEDRVCGSGIEDLRVEANDGAEVRGHECEGAVMEKDFELLDFFGGVVEWGRRRGGSKVAAAGAFGLHVGWLPRIVEQDQRESVGSGRGGGGHAWQGVLVYTRVVDLI